MSRGERTTTPYSCPKLDEVLSALEAIQDQVTGHAADAETAVEEARSLHDQLRTEANDALERLEAAEKRIEELEAELARVTEDRDWYEAELAKANELAHA